MVPTQDLVERRSKPNGFRIDLNIVMQTVALLLVIGGYIVRAEARMARFEEQIVSITKETEACKLLIAKLENNQALVVQTLSRISTIQEFIEKRHAAEDARRR